MLTTGFQLRAARSLIGMDQSVLADLAKLNVNTIRSMEAGGLSAIAGRAGNVQAVQRALEAAGVEFLNHGRPGVRLKGISALDEHPEPVGPATDVLKRMEAEIHEDRERPKRKPR